MRQLMRIGFSARRCAFMSKSLRWIGAEITEIPSNHDLTDIQEFLEQFEQQIPYEQRIAAMDLAVRATPARWWYVHKEISHHGMILKD